MSRLLFLCAIFCFALSSSALGGFFKARQVTTDGSATSFSYTENWTPSTFTLTDGQINFSGPITNGTSYLIFQSTTSGYALTDIKCVCYQSNAPGTTPSTCLSTIVPNLGDGEVAITFQGDELVRCTFVDTPSPCTGSACVPSCGNGVIDTGEQCDHGVHNSDNAFGPDECTTQCTIPANATECAIKALRLYNSCNQLPGQTSEVSVMLMILAALFWSIRALRTRTL